MFKKLSSAVFAASLVAFAQPALAQAITPTLTVVNQPVKMGAYGIKMNGGNLLAFNSWTTKNTPGTPNFLYLTGSTVVWTYHSQVTEMTLDGAKLNSMEMIPAKVLSAGLYCYLNGYLFTKIGVVTKLVCSTKSSFIP